MGSRRIFNTLRQTHLENRLFFIFLSLWILIFLGIRTVQHFSFGTNACDLSLFDYGMHSTLKGQLMSDPFHKFGFGRWDVSNGELTFVPGYAKSWESHFCIHFTPIIFFIVPFYLIFEGPLFLLYLQVLAVGLSALPLYFIAKAVFKAKYAALSIAVIYLFFRQLLIGLMHDTHMEMYFPLFLFSSVYFVAIKKRRVPYFLFITLALLIKEDIAIYIFFLGIFLILKFREKKYGFITSVYAFLYFILAFGVIIPYFRKQAGMDSLYVYAHVWGYAGNNILQVMANMLSHPGEILKHISLGSFLKAFSNIVSPLLLLPFFSSFFFLALPPLFLALLSKNPQFYTFGIHYSATLLPFIFLAFLEGLKNIKKFFYQLRGGRFRKVFSLILILLLAINLANSSFWRVIKPSRYKALGDYWSVKKIIDQVPPQASVAALSAIIPHIPKRKNIFMLPETDEADYIIVHAGINLWPYTKEQFSNFLARIEKEKRYICVYQEGEIKFFKKKQRDSS